MATPRKNIVNAEITPYYHCTSRCVRRAFLCGRDRNTGRNYDHRKRWIVKRIRYLATVFSIDVAGYAVLDNHYHVVVRLDPKRVKNWSEKEIAGKWAMIYNNDLAKAFAKDLPLDSEERQTLKERIPVWRQRLTNLSWFMRCINEPVARMANREDECSGHFWEGRYFSQALCDSAALLTCLAYVDLNPIRAKLASKLERCNYTSIQERLKRKRTKPKISQSSLLPFENEKTGGEPFLPGTFNDYLTLLKNTGRLLLQKSDWPNNTSNRIFLHLGINAEHWVHTVKNFQRCYRNVAGSATALKSWAESIDMKWFWGLSLSKRFYS